MEFSFASPVRGGHCATCHSGPVLNETNAFNPIQEAGGRLSNNFVSETNTAHGQLPPLGIALPEHTYHVIQPTPVFMPNVPLFPIPIPPGTPLIPPGIEFVLQ